MGCYIKFTRDGRREVHRDGHPTGYQIAQGFNVPEWGPGTCYYVIPPGGSDERRYQPDVHAAVAWVESALALGAQGKPTAHIARPPWREVLP